MEQKNHKLEKTMLEKKLVTRVTTQSLVNLERSIICLKKEARLLIKTNKELHLSSTQKAKSGVEIRKVVKNISAYVLRICAQC